MTAVKYAKETFWAFAAKGTAFVFYYALFFYLTRNMSVDTWGNWSAFLAVFNIIAFASEQGINTASKRYIAEARDTPRLHGVVRATFTLRLLASFGFTLVIAFLVGPLLVWLHQADQVQLMQQSLLLIALYGIMDYFKILFEALHRLRFTFVLNALEHGLKFLLVIALFHEGGQFLAIIIAFTIAVGVALAAGVFIAFREIPPSLTSIAGSHLMRQVYFYSLPVFLVSVGGLVSLEIDTIMLKYFRTATDAGIYSTAKNIVMFLPQIGLAFSMGTIPGLSVFDAHTALAKRRVYYQVLGGIAGVYVLICLVVAAFGYWGIERVFRPEYHAASIPLLMLIPFTVFNAATIYSGNLMIYRGLAWQRSFNAALSIVANVLLNWWLIPIWGPIGAATASSIAYLPYCILNLRGAHKAFAMGIPPR